MIDDRVAAMAFPNESADRQDVSWRESRHPKPQTFEIIGVVAHQRHTTLVGDEKESIYFSNGAQGSGAGALDPSHGRRSGARSSHRCARH